MTQQFGQGFEGLEERTLLAANVTATLVGDTLVIEGDATSNDIDVFGDGTNGQITVLTGGQELAVSGGTLEEPGQGSFTGVANIVVRGNEGDDYIHVSDIDINGNLTVQGGIGEDYIALHTHQFDTFIGGGVILNGGVSLNDDIEVETLGYGSDLTIGGGLAMLNNGGAYGSLDIAAAYGNISIGGGVFMSTFSLAGSEGDAEMRADYGNLSVGGSVVMSGGLGDDFLGIFAGYGATADNTSKTGVSIAGSVIMNGGWGNDELLITAYGYGLAPNAAAPAQPVGLGVSNNMEIGGGVYMLGGVGNDYLSVGGQGADVAIGGSLNQFGGFGDDSLNAFAYDYGVVSVAGHALADGGEGNDWIGAYGTVVGGGSVIHGGLGFGDDDINLENNVVNGNVWVFGGFGNDTFCVENNFIGGSAGLFGGLGWDRAYVGDNQVNGFFIPLSIEQYLNFCPFDVPV